MTTPAASRSTVRISSALAAVFFTVSLAACGGGGGGDSTGSTGAAPAPAPGAPAPAPAPTPAPAPAPTSGPINTTPQVSTYVAGTAEATAFASLNSERGTCGFGYLTQSTVLDAAAADADTYFINRAAEGVVSASSFSHAEDGGKSGFTGVFPSDRAAFRGYVFNGDITAVSEDNATFYSNPAIALDNTTLSAGLLKVLLTSVYHVSGLMTSRTQIGIGFVRPTTSDGYDAPRLEIVTGIPASGVRQAGTAVRTYPCAGTTLVSGSFIPANESPNPAPDLGSTIVGTPIYINGIEGQTLTVTSATVVRTSDSSPVSVRVITYNNDPFYVANNAHALSPNEAFVLPLAPLEAGTSYTVNVLGDNNGAAFTKTFAFTPGV